jgi:hypothetical protein
MNITDFIGLPKGWVLTKEQGIGPFDNYILTNEELGASHAYRVSYRDRHDPWVNVESQVRKWAQEKINDTATVVLP